MGSKLLIIDDDPDIRKLLLRIAEDAGLMAASAADAAEGVRLAEELLPDAILLDIDLPDRSGMDLLPDLIARLPDTAIMMITAHADLETAIQALRLGAIDYIQKPLVIDEVRNKLARAADTVHQRRELLRLRRELGRREPGMLAGTSAAIREVQRLIDAAAPARTTVLITGETGTGKELVARSVHAASPRADRAFVAINCAALPEHLIESELFGYNKGAFTGAETARKGLIEEADGGTLFLDEIGDMPLASQAKLLRVIEERKVQRLGANVAVPVDVRIVAATHANLQQRVAEGAFREDLWYRLQVLEIRVPPLRERPDDIIPIAERLLQQLGNDFGHPAPGLTNDAANTLRRYDWPGNVRELRNVLERAMLFATTDIIDVEHLPAHLPGAADNGDAAALPHFPDDLHQAVAAFERLHITRILQDCGGKKAEAARRLGIDRSTLYRKLEATGAPGTETGT